MFSDLSNKHILFEDEDLIAWNKPAGLLTHATLDPHRDNLYSAALKFLQTRAAHQGEDPHSIYLGLHHRLDRETSGVVLMTKSKRANPSLQKQFQDHSIEKIYWAIASEPKSKLTSIRASNFVVENYLNKKSKKEAAMEAVRSGGDRARTEFKILGTAIGDRENIFYWIEARPQTGRTHQIRTHLASVGLPLISDTLYGGLKDQLPSHFLLHAQSIQFLHPVTENSIRVVAALPQEFRTIARQHGFSITESV